MAVQRFQMEMGNVAPAGVHGRDEDDLEEDGSDLLSVSEVENIEDGSEADADSEVDGRENDGDQVTSTPIDDEPDISTVSFGALQQAQESLSRKRKRSSDTNVEHEEKLDALRARLRQIKASKQRNDEHQQERQSKALATMSPSKHADAMDPGSDSDSAPSEVGAVKSRTSKHAPRSQSSKYQVTRKRAVIDVPKRVTRDPRFDALPQSAPPTVTSNKAYAFLRDYQKSEIAELKGALKQAKTEEDKTTLRRQLVAMENRIKAEDAKEREQEVLRQHRREEKDKVQQGKKPFYLKQKEVKDRALVEKYKGMKGKDRQKLLEKRRLKESQREKKRMPEGRREA